MTERRCRLEASGRGRQTHENLVGVVSNNTSLLGGKAGRRGGYRFDRRFYIIACLGAFAIVFAGFARTYYLKGLFGTPALPWLLHVHGALMSGWFVLFLVQSYLIASHRVATHRRLGILGVSLAVSMVVVVVTVLVGAVARDVRNPAAGPRSILFLGTGLANIGVFATLVAAAIALRRRADFHKRLMLLATLTILVAALARIPLGFIEGGGLSVAILLADLGIAFVVAVDTFRNRRLHPAFAWGAALFVVSMHLANIGARTQAWTRFVTWMVS
jgi:hypothetical protein